MMSHSCIIHFVFLTQLHKEVLQNKSSAYTASVIIIQTGSSTVRATQNSGVGELCVGDKRELAFYLSLCTE